MHRRTGGSAGVETAAVSELAALRPAIGPAGGCAGSTHWAARGLTANPTSAQHAVAPRAPVRADARPSVGEGMIPERAGCGKSARPVRRAATGNGVGINRIMPARHRASRRLHPSRLSNKQIYLFSIMCVGFSKLYRIQTALAAPSHGGAGPQAEPKAPHVGHFLPACAHAGTPP